MRQHFEIAFNNIGPPNQIGICDVPLGFQPGPISANYVRDLRILALPSALLGFYYLYGMRKANSLGLRYDIAGGVAWAA
jgi:hypothetical protein